MCLYINIYKEISKQKSLAISWQKKKESLPFGKDSPTVDNTPTEYYVDIAHILCYNLTETCAKQSNKLSKFHKGGSNENIR